MTETPVKLSPRDLRPAQRELSGVVVKKVGTPGEAGREAAAVPAVLLPTLERGQVQPAGEPAAVAMDSAPEKPASKLRETPIDLGLVAAAQAGNPDALNQVVAQSEPKVLAYLRHHFKGSPEDVSDLSQEVLAKIAQRLAQFKNTGKPFESWLLTVATNQLRDLYRAQGRQQITTESLDEGYDDSESGPRTEPVATDDTAAEAVGEISRKQLLAKLREGLTSKQFQVLILKTKKLTNAEIARRLSMGEEGVKQLYYRAQENARKIALGEAIDDPSETPPAPEPAPQRFSLGTITAEEAARAGLGPRQSRILELVEQGQDMAGVRRALGSTSNTTDGSLVDSYVNGVARVLKARGDTRDIVEIKRSVAEVNPLRPEQTAVSLSETGGTSRTPAATKSDAPAQTPEVSPRQPEQTPQPSHNPDFPIRLGLLSDAEAAKAKLGSRQRIILEMIEQGYDTAGIIKDYGPLKASDVAEAYRGGVAKVLKSRGDPRSLYEIKRDMTPAPAVTAGSERPARVSVGKNEPVAELTERQKTAQRLKSEGKSDYEVVTAMRNIPPEPEKTPEPEYVDENGISATDIGNWLSVTETLVAQRCQDDPSNSLDAGNLVRIRNRIKVFRTLYEQSRKTHNESSLRTLFAPEIAQIAKLKEYSKSETAVP